MRNARSLSVERAAEKEPDSKDPVQRLKDAAVSARMLKAQIEDAQQKEREPVLRDPSRREPPRRHPSPVRKAV